MIEQDKIHKLILEGKIKEAIKEAGEDISLLIEVLKRLSVQNPPIDGLNLAKSIIELYPHNVAAHEINGDMLFNVRRVSDAESEFYLAYFYAKESQKKSEILTDLAGKLKSIKSDEDALYYYKKAIYSNPHNVQAIKERGDLFKDHCKYKEAEQHYRKVLDICASKEAEQECKSALNSSRYFFEYVKFSLGDVLYELKNYNEAICEYKQVINVLSLLIEKNESLIKQNRYVIEQNRDLLKQSKNENLERENSVLESNITALENKNKKLKKKLSNVHNHLGMALFKLKKFGEAKDYFDKAISHNEFHGGAHINLGLVYIEQGDEEKDEKKKENFYKNGLEQFQKSLVYFENDAKPHSYCGLAQMKLKASHEAKNCFELAISEDPNFVDSYINLGVLYAQAEEYDKAIEKFEEAMSLDPKSPKAYSNLISAKLKITKTEEIDWWQTSTIHKLGMWFLIILLVLSIFMSFGYFGWSILHGSQIVTETQITTKSLNSTTTTTINSLTNFGQIIVLIGTLVLLLCLPYLKKLKIGSSGVEFEIENSIQKGDEGEKSGEASANS